MVRRVVSEGLDSQTAHISKLTEQFRQTLAGLKQGQERLVKLHDQFESRHQKLADSHQVSVDKLLEDGSSTYESHKVRLDALCSGTEERLSTFAKSMGENVEAASAELKQKLTAQQEDLKGLRDDWGRRANEEHQQTERQLAEVGREVRGALDRLEPMAGALDQTGSQIRALERELEGTRTRLEFLQVENQRRADDAEAAFKKMKLWSVSLSLAVLVLLILQFSA